MLTERFNRLWDRLVTRWFAYQETPRTPDRIVDLADARVALDEARTEIGSERYKITGPGQPRQEQPRVAMSEEELARLRAGGIDPP